MSVAPPCERDSDAAGSVPHEPLAGRRGHFAPGLAASHMLLRNVGGLDRTLRAALAVALLVVAVRANREGNRFVAEFAAVAAASFLFTAVTCFCGLNAVLGIDATSRDR